MVKKYEEFLLEQELRLYEIGEGSRPFSYTRKGSTRVESWLGEMGTVDKSKMVEGRYESLPPLMYQFKSDKATYYARLSAGYKKHTYIPAFSNPGAPKPQDFDLVIVVSFDIEGSDDAKITNFGEQFRVITTVTDITETVVKELEGVKWIKLQEIRIVPKLEDEEEGKPITQSKRGRLYLEYIKKQGKRLPGDWTAKVEGEYFVLIRGKWSGGNDPSRFIQL